MPFKSDTQPYCRYCAKAIGKHTVVAYFGRANDRDEAWFKERTAKPATRTEAAKMFDERIVSTRRGQYVHTVYLWDGESYRSQYFCSNMCAQSLGRLVALEGRCTNKYNLRMSKINAARAHIND